MRPSGGSGFFKTGLGACKIARMKPEVEPNEVASDFFVMIFLLPAKQSSWSKCTSMKKETVQMLIAKSHHNGNVQFRLHSFQSYVF